MAIRVLIADSQPHNREKLRAFLTSEPDIEIAGMARDGQEALLLVHQQRPRHRSPGDLTGRTGWLSNGRVFGRSHAPGDGFHSAFGRRHA